MPALGDGIVEHADAQWLLVLVEDRPLADPQVVAEHEPPDEHLTVYRQVVQPTLLVAGQGDPRLGAARCPPRTHRRPTAGRVDRLPDAVEVRLLPEQLGMLIDGTGEALPGSDTWFRLGDATGSKAP